MDHSAFAHYFDVAFDIVTIGASLGGVTALSRLLSDLPGDFPCPIVVVQHISANSPGLLADLLNRRTKLSVKLASNGERIRPRTVYIAPPDRHLLVTTGR